MEKLSESRLNELKGEILIESYELFGMYGITRVTMRDIAHRAKISRSALYTYFGNKRGLVHALLDMQRQRVEAVIKYLMSEEVNFESKLSRLMRFKLQAMQEMGDNFIQDILSDREYMEHLHSIQDKFSNGFIEFLEREKEAGNIKEMFEPEFIFLFLQSIEYQLTDKRFHEFYSSLGELTMSLMEIVLRGICTGENR